MTVPDNWRVAHRGPRAGGRFVIALVAIALACAGCGVLPLERKTILQGSTLTDIQYQQVLDNLAMFSCNPNSLAWHIKITGGVVQVADQGSGFIGANLGGPGVIAPNVGLQRNVLNQWNVDPVVESGDLELLQIAYRKAVDPLDADGSIKRAAYEQICDLASHFHIVPTHDVTRDIVETVKRVETGAGLARLQRIEADLETLYAEIDLLSSRSQAYRPDELLVNGNEVPSKLDFLKEEVIRLLHEACHNSVEPVRAYHRPGRNAGLVEQAQDKIEALVKLFEEHDSGQPNQFSSPWVVRGGKHDVPACACLVGHYCGCGCDCYVWISPDDMQKFRDFVLIVLALAPPSSQDAASAPMGIGAANSFNF